MAIKEKITTLASNIGIFVVVFAIMISISEMVVRIMYKDTTVMFPRYHTAAIYGDYTLRTIRQNSNYFHSSIDGRWEFTTNRQGFRNYNDFEFEKPEGITRIIALGDSQTQGYEVHQEFTFSSIIEKYLDRRSINSEVINTGVSGFSTAEELLLLDNELLKYQPDYVVLGFYSNDFQDNLKSAFFALDANKNLIETGKTAHIPGVKIQNIIYSIPGIQWLSENSYFYSMLFNNVWKYAKQLLTKGSAVKVMDIAINTKENFSDYERTLAARLIERIYEACNTHGAKFILVDIPKIGRDGIESPSIDQEFFNDIRNDSDFYQSSNILLPYQGLGLIHQPHGLRHITRFTHTLLGIGIGEYIASDLKARNNN